MFFGFRLVKNHKIANNSTITSARKNISTVLNPYNFCMGLAKFENNQILLNKKVATDFQ